LDDKSDSNHIIVATLIGILFVAELQLQ